MSQTLKHISKFFKKDLDRFENNMKKEFKIIDSNLFLKETLKSKSIADLTKEYFDAGHL
jgi:hypothetical protein